MPPIQVLAPLFPMIYCIPSKKIHCTEPSPDLGECLKSTQQLAVQRGVIVYRNSLHLTQTHQTHLTLSIPEAAESTYFSSNITWYLSNRALPYSYTSPPEFQLPIPTGTHSDWGSCTVINHISTWKGFSSASVCREKWNVACLTPSSELHPSQTAPSTPWPQELQPSHSKTAYS